MTGQTNPSWRLLPAAPFLASSRIDDAFFLNATLGWIANGYGQVWRTTNGGGNWVKQFDKNTVYFRCLSFADSMRGWACNLGTEEFGGATDTNIIYQTTNSGATWAANNNFFPQKPRGLCGMQAVGDSFIYAVGRVRGPSFFVRSTDGGNHWEVRDMSAFAVGLLDVYFFTRDSGYVIGHNGPVNTNSNGVILFTSDRGTTWQVRFTTTRIGEWCWKINFPTRQVGFISLQRNSGAPVYFLKTADGGVTWQEKLFSTTSYYVQGIGFANPLRGWIGGNSTLPTYETTDGGDTWFQQPFGVRLNRVRMLNDTIGYSVGQGVYKYSRELPTGIAEPSPTPSSFALLEIYPNPFNAQTTIQYSIIGGADDPATPHRVSVKVHDLLGREVATLVDEEKRAGTYRIKFDGVNLARQARSTSLGRAAGGLASGVYIVRLIVSPGRDGAPVVSGRFVDSKKLILLK
jgi:photosystem II stability/assembly factor-like uncharacterized protein